MAAVRAVPQIDNNPETVSDQETRYGYVAYHDIALGNDHQVQPSDSPYHKVLPCRELIPFTNIPVGEINIEKYGKGGTFNKSNVSPITVRTKSAAECAREMEQSYQEWAFVVLNALNGLDAETAFRIFQTVQPFAYKLADIEDELADATSRIEAIAPYQVSYQGETVELLPLTDAEADRAKRILPLIQASAAQAVKIGGEKVDRTIESMTNRFSGGEGKRTADPHDRYLANEFGQDLPKLVTNQAQQAQAAPAQQFVQTESPEALDLKRREMDLRERELIAKEIELGIRPRPEPPPVRKSEERFDAFHVAEPVSLSAEAASQLQHIARPSVSELIEETKEIYLPERRICAATKVDGAPCKALAISNSPFCVAHSK